MTNQIKQKDCNSNESNHLDLESDENKHECTTASKKGTAGYPQFENLEEARLKRRFSQERSTSD
jgi:hypothetical protein